MRKIYYHLPNHQLLIKIIYFWNISLAFFKKKSKHVYLSSSLMTQFSNFNFPGKNQAITEHKKKSITFWKVDNSWIKCHNSIIDALEVQAAKELHSPLLFRILKITRKKTKCREIEMHLYCLLTANIEVRFQVQKDKYILMFRAWRVHSPRNKYEISKLYWPCRARAARNHWIQQFAFPFPFSFLKSYPFLISDLLSKS